MATTRARLPSASPQPRAAAWFRPRPRCREPPTCSMATMRVRLPSASPQPRAAEWFRPRPRCREPPTCLMATTRARLPSASPQPRAAAWFRPEAALQRTAHMFDGDDASAPSVGFATAKGSRVVPSEAALQRTAHMFDGDDASAPSVGFATAKGGRVVPSEAALQRTAHMFDGDDGSSTDNRAVGQSGSSLMHADHGSKVQSSWPAGGAGDCGAGKDRRVPPSRPFSAPSAVTRGGLARPTAGRSADSAPLGVRRAIGGTARSAKRGRGRFVVPTPVTAYGRGVAAHPTTTALPVRSTLGGSARAIRRAFKCRPSPKARVPHACADRRGDRQPRAFRLDRSKARRYPRSVRHDRRGSRKVRVVCDKTTRKPFRRGDAVRSAQRLTASLEVARRRGR